MTKYTKTVIIYLNIEASQTTQAIKRLQTYLVLIYMNGIQSRVNGLHVFQIFIPKCKETQKFITNNIHQ